MKYEDVDWTILRGSLITLIISISLCTSIVIGSLYFQKQMKREYNRNNNKFISISSRYLDVDEEEKLISSYYPRFIELYENGIIGDEQRLNWIEVLRRAGQEIKLPALNYQIESQKSYAPEFQVELGKYNIYRSRMTLTMQLLHEGDLFSIIQTLNREAKGSYRISSCQLAKFNQEIQDNLSQGNINAKCNFDWYTIRLRDGKKIDV